MKVLKLILLFVALAIIGVGIGWLASRRPEVARSTVPVTATAKTPGDGVSPAASTAPTMGVASLNTNEVMIPVEGADESETTSTNLDDKIGDILGEDTDITNIVTELVDLYPKLSDDGKLEAAEHLTNLVPDDDYQPLANILTNGTATAAVASHLLADLIERPNNIKMPLMLTVARDPKHPGAKEAKENLELLISPEEDLGDDWDKWDKAVQDWLKENPE